MKLSVSKLIGTAALALLMLLSVAADTFGQGRGRRVFGLGDKKCAKFVNCHDARDGRWDGRGPRRNNNVLSSIGIFRRSRRVRRDRDFDRDRSWRRHRHDR